MIAAHIHEALAQVRELKMRVLNAERFTGYSGRSRAVGGVAAMLAPWVSFTNPWPMGIVFGIGEWIGGFIFHRGRCPNAALTQFFYPGGPTRG